MGGLIQISYVILFFFADRVAKIRLKALITNRLFYMTQGTKSMLLDDRLDVSSQELE